jgi:hypothetical protein
MFSLKSPSLSFASISGRPQEDHVPDGLRQAWKRIPPGARLVIPITLLLATVIAAFYVWMKPSRDDWSALPGRLVCQAQSGPSPPPPVTVASVGVTHPRGSILQLVIRFVQPLPPSPSYGLTYSLANNGTTFAVLTPQQGSDELTIRNAKRPGAADVRTDKETHAARTGADTVEISLDLTKFGITKGLVSPALTVSSQLDTPAPASGYAAQTCHG